MPLMMLRRLPARCRHFRYAVFRLTFSLRCHAITIHYCHAATRDTPCLPYLLRLPLLIVASASLCYACRDADVAAAMPTPCRHAYDARCRCRFAID